MFTLRNGQFVWHVGNTSVYQLSVAYVLGAHYDKPATLAEIQYLYYEAK